MSGSGTQQDPRETGTPPRFGEGPGEGLTTREGPGERSSPESRIREQFPDAVQESILAVDVPTLTIAREQIEAVAEFVKEALGYRLPACASGVDRIEHFEVVYHLMSLKTNGLFGLKVKLPKEDPRMPTLTGVWRGVDWHEREIFDLLGVIFDGHPDLRRILLPDDWEGHPLRKDFKEID
jgi:NADH-quinone oxidoreductase subunit C